MIHLKKDETTIYHFHEFFYQNECEKMCSYLVEIDSQDENDNNNHQRPQKSTKSM